MMSYFIAGGNAGMAFVPLILVAFLDYFPLRALPLLLLPTILIAVLGGVDPYGGKGNMKGVIVAILIVQMISSWLNMYESISNFYRQIIWGGLLIFVLIYNYVVNEREKKKASQN